MTSRCERYLRAIQVCRRAIGNLEECRIQMDWKEAVTSCIEHFLTLLDDNKTSFYEALSCLQVPELVEVFVATWYSLRHSPNNLSRKRKLFSILVRVSIVSGKYSQLFQLFFHMARRNCFVDLCSETEATSLKGTFEIQRELALIAYYWNSYDLHGLFPWECIIDAAVYYGDIEAELVFIWLFGNSLDLDSQRWLTLNNNWSVWTEIELLEYTKHCIVGNIAADKAVVNNVSKGTLGFVSGPLEITYSPDFGLSHICDFPLILPFNDNELEQSEKRCVISNFVLLEHFVPIIYECLQCIAMGIPILLQGPSGSGKSALLHLLSQIREQNKVFRLQNMEKESSLPRTINLCMSGCRGIEDFDELVGTIVPDVQSEGFIWKAGPIGAAIGGGHWLVLEELHNTSHATCCGIERLVELRGGEKLEVSGRKRPLETAFGFHLFGTSTCDEVDTQESYAWEPPGGSWKWKRIHLPSLLQDESDGCLHSILQCRFPCLRFCHQRLVSTMFMLLHMYRERKWNRFCRPASLTDWIRICSRLENLQVRGETPSAQVAVSECLDVLCAWDADKSRKSRVYSILSEAWSLPFDTVQYLDTATCPQLSTCTDNPLDTIVRMGRAQWRLERISNPSTLPSDCSWMKQTLRLWERIARCVEMKEPVLLCGETGTGKTSAVQELAKMMGVSVVVLNLSPQTEWNDLIGTYRPYHPFQDMQHLKQLFVDAFCLSFGAEKNQNFLRNLDSALEKKDIDRCYRLIVGAWKKIEQSISLTTLESNQQEKWYHFRENLTRFEKVYGDSESSFQLKKRKRKDAIDWNECRNKNPVTFRFQLGPLIRAMKEGHWILLDEINLAPFEILEGLSMLLEHGVLSVFNSVLSNNEENTYLEAHPNFRIFAAMNPPTDVGKKGLRESIRKKFTEIYVSDSLDEEDLIILICKRYFGREREDSTDEEYGIARDVARFYFSSKQLCESQYLVDSNGRKPHYSLRSLCRMLDLARSIYNRSKSVGKSWMRHKRALYEGALLSFVSPLPLSCRCSVERLADEIFQSGNSLRNLKMSELVKVHSSKNHRFIEMEGYWILCQHNMQMSSSNSSTINEGDDQFIATPSVRQTMRDILRTLQFGAPKYAVLLQGPTASGKTSLVSYLARTTGQTLLRINHHEHMDLSEYFGNFQMDDTGSFQFVQGPLLKAVRLGYWVVMDELNLAPNELLEALNRLLDDNREIYVPELAQTFRAHENFVLFATQNPSGEYAGRKQLSRAFRGRFIELNVGELSMEELNMILQKRYQLPESFTQRMIKVMHELQIQRARERIFLGKESLISARDLFRWASRTPNSKESLAREGFYLLGERCRTIESREFIRKVLIDCIGVSEEVLKDEHLYPSIEQNDERWMQSLVKLNVVPTPSLFRMITLVKRALAHREPVLLIGETGIGKTTCIQVLAEYEKNLLWTVSCHRHLDVSDFVGAFRPRRKSDSRKLFEWVDGPLVSAMKAGNYFLLDEVNMASDAVIERLNSVLEPERTLTEYKSSSSHDSCNVKAHSNFCFIAAMNPASDYGKKECSAAFRSRLTEIWVPPTNAAEEYVDFIAQSWPSHSPFHIYVQPMQELVLCVLNDLESSPPLEKQTLYSMFTWRDIRSWMNFIESSRELFQHPFSSYAHGFDLILLDGLAMSSLSTHLERLQQKWKRLLLNQCKEKMSLEEIQGELYIRGLSDRVVPMWEEDSAYRFGSLKLNKVNKKTESDHQSILSIISLDTDTMRRNAFRIVRAMSLKKPILLQGPPGIGKTSMIQALACLCGQRLLRVNLSEHTEMSDLIGMDVPSNNWNDDERNAPFVFRPGPLLLALQGGFWILLDELNLAPQTVLEGLNSLLDHRRSIYVAELDKEFYADDQPSFMLFATQNPAVDGGGRKQLPRSFQSRFTRVAMEQLHLEDMCPIAEKRFPNLDRSFIRKGLQVLENIQRNEYQLDERVENNWLFEDLNLRDVLRWFSCVDEHFEVIGDFHMASYLFFESLIVERLGMDVRSLAIEKYDALLSVSKKMQEGLGSFAIYRKDECHVQAGALEITWDKNGIVRQQEEESCPTQSSDSRWIECYQRNAWILSIGILHHWPMILLGKRGSGRKSLIRTLSNIFGQRLVEWNPSGMDADGSNFIGSYQVLNTWEVLWEVLQVDVISSCQKILATISLEEKQRKMIVKDLYSVSKRMRKLCLELNRKEGVSFQFMDGELRKLVAFMKQLFVNTSLERWMESLCCRLEECRQMCRKEKKSFSMFHWAYSSFIETAKRGDWILLDEAHRYPPAILDALNPFLEDSVSGANKTVWLTADGEERENFCIDPHFRIFFVVEQGKQHQLSKALWNRALVTYLPDLAGDEPKLTMNLKDLYKFSYTLIERNVFTCSPIVDKSVVHIAYDWWNENIRSLRRNWPFSKEIVLDCSWSYVIGFIHSMGKTDHLGIPEDSLLAHIYWLYTNRQDAFSQCLYCTEEYRWLQQWISSKMPDSCNIGNQFLVLCNYPVLYLSEFLLQMSFWAKYYRSPQRWMPLVTQLLEFNGFQESQYHPILNAMLHWFTQSLEMEPVSICISNDQMHVSLMKEGVDFLLQYMKGYDRNQMGEDFQTQTIRLLEYLWNTKIMDKLDIYELERLFTVGSWTLIQWNYYEMETVMVIALLSFFQQTLKDCLLLEEMSLENRVIDWFHQCNEVLLSMGGWKLEFLQSYYLFEPLHKGEIDYDDSLVGGKLRVQWYTLLRSQVEDNNPNISREAISKLNVVESQLMERFLLCQETCKAFTVWHFWTSLLFWNGNLPNCSKQLPVQWLNTACMMSSSSNWNMECLISQQQLIWLSECHSDSRTIDCRLAWMEHFLAQGSLSVIQWLMENPISSSHKQPIILENGWIHLTSCSLFQDWQRNMHIESNTGHMNALEYSLQVHHSKQFLRQLLDVLYLLHDERVFEPHDLLERVYHVQTELWKRIYSTDVSSEECNNPLVEKDDSSLFSIGWKWFIMARQHLQNCILFQSKYHPRRIAQSMKEWQQVLEEMFGFRYFHFLQESYGSLYPGCIRNELLTNHKQLYDLMDKYPQLAETFLLLVNDLLSTERLDCYQNEMWKCYDKRNEKNPNDVFLQEWNQWQVNLQHSLISFSKMSKDWGLIDQVLVAGYEMLLGSYWMTRDLLFHHSSSCSDQVPSPLCYISWLPSKCVVSSLQHDETGTNLQLFISQLMTLKWLYYLRIERNVSKITCHGMAQIHKHLGKLVAQLGLQTNIISPNEENQVPISWNFEESSKDVWFDEQDRESWDQLYLQAHLLEDMTSDHSASKLQLDRSKRHIWFIQLIVGLLTQWNPRQTSCCKQQLQEIYSFASCAVQQESDMVDDLDVWINESDYWDIGGWVLLYGMEGEIPKQEDKEDKLIIRKSHFQFYQDSMPSELVQLKEPLEQTFKFLKQYQSMDTGSKSIMDKIEEDLHRIQQLSRKTSMIHVAQLVKQWKDHLVMWQKQWLGQKHSIGNVITHLQRILDKWNNWLRQQHWEKEWIDWREERVQMNSLDYFLPLYVFLHQSSCSESTVCLEDVMQVMDFFVRTAVIGDFSLRVNIVKSFYLIFRCSEDCSWLSHLLRGIYCYYQQYENRILHEYSKRRKTAVEKIQRNIEYSYHYNETSADEMANKVGFPLALRQKAIQIARELERDLSDSISPLLKDVMEDSYNKSDSRAKQLFANVTDSLKRRQEEIIFRERRDSVHKEMVLLSIGCTNDNNNNNNNGCWDKFSHFLSIWNESFHVWGVTSDTFCHQDFQHWLYVLKENEISCYPSAIPRSHRSLSFQLSCPVIGEGESIDSWNTLETHVSLQDELYFSCLAQSCWIRRWLLYLPEQSCQDSLSGDRKQIWNEMNMGLHFGKYLQFMSLQLRQAVDDLRHCWRNSNVVQNELDDMVQLDTQLYVQFTEWITLYEEYCKMRQEPLERDEQLWFSQLQQAVEEFYLKKSSNLSSSLEKLFKVPMEKKWQHGIFVYVQHLASLWERWKHRVEVEDHRRSNDEVYKNDVEELIQSTRRRLLEENQVSGCSLYVVFNSILKALQVVKEQMLSSTRSLESKYLQNISTETIEIAVICDAICCLWWKLTNDMIFTGIQQKWIQQVSEADTEIEYGSKDVKGTGLQDASIQSMQEANDISDQLDEQDWQEAFEKLGSQDNQPEMESTNKRDDGGDDDIQAQVEMDDTWQDNGNLEEDDKVEDVESGEGEDDPRISENQETNGLESSQSLEQNKSTAQEPSKYDDNDCNINEDTLSEKEDGEDKKLSELKEEYLENINGEFRDENIGEMEEEHRQVAEEMETFPESLESLSETSFASHEEEVGKDEMSLEDVEKETNSSWEQPTSALETDNESNEEENDFASEEQDKPCNRETAVDNLETNHLTSQDDDREGTKTFQQMDPHHSSSLDNSQGDATSWILNPYTESTQDIWKHLLEKVDLSLNSSDAQMEDIQGNEELQGVNSDLQDMDRAEKMSDWNAVNEQMEVTNRPERSELEQVLDSQLQEEIQESSENSLGMSFRKEANTDATHSFISKGEEKHSKEDEGNEENENDQFSLQSDPKNKAQNRNSTVEMPQSAASEDSVETNSMQVTQDLDQTLLSTDEEDLRVGLTQRTQIRFLRGTIGEKDSQVLWQQLLQKTSQEAALLAERLQMILEPSVTSQLTGSYRTGKKLSMKKVIEFYASDFRKDRIWLRRVQPDRRSYDVLIAIDDSASMMESQASILAMETLALLASSFTRYEIGRLAVARFGNEVHWLRSFDDSLSMEVGGAEILRQFHFQQNATDIPELLRQAIGFLKESKATSPSSVSTIQLFFVLSDGRLQDRNAIKKLVREAWENGQLIVFLLTDYVDTKQQSIVNLKRVETLENGQLKISSYLDDFPFPFYILVRHVQSLPQVVASALQEWIEMMNPSRLDSFYV